MRVLRKAGIVSLCTLGSRVLGLVRDILSAMVFGSSPVMGAFVIAFRIPNLFRRLFGEGALAAAFIPTFSTYLHRDDRREAWRLFSTVATALAALLAGIVVALELLVLGADALMDVDPNTHMLLRLTAVMLPFMLFICMTALASATANVLERFALPALAPVVMNVFWIGALLGCLWWSVEPKRAVYYVAWAVVLSSVVQFVMQLPQLVRAGMRLRPRLDLSHPGLRQITRLMGPVVVGAATFQINLVVDSLLARQMVDRSAPAILYYSDRLIQLPMALFGLALATVIFVEMSRAAGENRFDDFRAILFRGIRGVLVVTVPAALGIAVLREPIITLFFRSGEFGPEAVERAGRVLLCYAPAVWIYSVLHLQVRAFYSLQNTRTPVRVSMGMVGLNLVLNVVFVLASPWVLGHRSEAGLALATSTSALVQMIVLHELLAKQVGEAGLMQVLWTFVKAQVAGVVMVAAVFGVHHLLMVHLLPGDWHDRVRLLVAVSVDVSVGVLVYSLVALLLRIDELKHVMSRAADKLLRRRNGKATER